MDRVQAVIFDLDGLMVDTEPLARKSWEKALADYDVHLEEIVFEQIVGLRRTDGAQVILDHLELPVGPSELLLQKEAYLASILEQGIPTMPGLRGLVAELARRSIPWAVASSSPLDYVNMIVDSIGLTDACQAIASGDEVEQGKPDPGVYLLAAERLSIPPVRCLALEDSVPGARAALAAGMVTAAVPNGHTNSADFNFVHYRFNSLIDLTEKLDSLITGKGS